MDEREKADVRCGDSVIDIGRYVTVTWLTKTLTVTVLNWLESSLIPVCWQSWIGESMGGKENDDQGRRRKSLSQAKIYGSEYNGLYSGLLCLVGG